MSEEPGPPQPTGRSSRRWLTAASVGVIATAVAAIATLISALTPIFGDDSPPQTSPVTTRGEENPDPPTRLVFRRAFSEPVTGWDVGAQTSACSANFGSAGYELVAVGRRLESGLYPYCVSTTHAIDGLTALPSVRVEVDAAFTRRPLRPDTSLGFGEILVRCRGRGASGPADSSYYAGMTTNGSWSLSEADRGAFHYLTSGKRQDLGFTEGQYRRLRLDCLARSNGEVRLVFYVDGEILATFTDAAPPPAGDIGLGIAASAKGKLAVAFRELVVYGP